MKGLLEAYAEFPSKAISCGDQNGDNIKDFVVTANSYSQANLGYVIIYKGRDDIVVDVNKEEINEIPSEFYLMQNYPNPFNPTTSIQYAVGSKQNITLKIYNILGNEIVTLVNEEQSAGKYEVKFNAGKYKLSSGIYFCELRIKDGSSSRIKMVYLK
jgi:hypothetical protein